jgi:3-hydroxyisobutyrate dehydrogenase-like beta-hydroxyacid dehydrogenase
MGVRRATETVAFLGLGRMGSRIARNIGRGGFPLVLYNRTTARAKELAGELAAEVASTPSQAASRADVVISMLSDDSAVNEVYSGKGAALSGLGPGKLAVDMSTVSPTFSLDLGERVRATGASMVDAPVSGSVATAESGSLLVMAGGDEPDVERIRPILETTASALVRVGPQGTGASMKLAVNAILFGLNEALSEALIVAERAGIDRLTAYDVIARSAAAAPAVHYRRNMFERPGEDPPSFTIDLAVKDLGLILDMARRVRAAVPQAELNLEVMQEAAATGRGQEDIAAVAQHLRHR